MIRISLTVIIIILFTIEQASSQSTKAPLPASTGKVITGLVLDDSGQPVAGAQIIVDQVGVRDRMQFIHTDDAGRFKTSALASGLYAMEVHWPGYVIRSKSVETDMHRAGEHLTINLIKGGVITGRVTDMTGEPIVSVNVIARRVRESEENSVPQHDRGRQTDDRGVFRIYGLEAGRYVVSAHVSSGVYVGGSDAGDEMPTYYPSSMRDTAVEIAVGAGEEVSGIDIQLRGGRGHAISGIVTGDTAIEGVGLKLVNASSGIIEKATYLHKSPRFVFYGIPDGEYDLYARKLYRQDGNAGSSLRRVVLRGADLLGVDLKLIKYGTISGRVQLDSPKSGKPDLRCESQHRSQLEEIMLFAKSDNPSKRRQDQFFETFEYWGSWRGSVVNQKGEFTIHNLESGLYRLDVDLPGEDWYVRSITQPAVGASKKSSEVSRTGIAIKSSEKLIGVEVLIAEGAAGLRGRAVPVLETQSKDGSRPSPRLQIHLLPAEETAAGDLLRYAETLASKDGSFEFKNLAPGKYWVLARPAPEVGTEEQQSKPLAWDQNERLKMRRDARKVEIELKPCQRIDEYALKVNLQ